jgi:metal-responsive CopG/Arc/MetJ family transcriptional regulator
MKAGDIMPRGGKRDGAGRKKIGENLLKDITISIPEELEKQVEESAEGKSRSDKFRYVIEKGLMKLDEEKEDNQGE